MEVEIPRSRGAYATSLQKKLKIPLMTNFANNTQTENFCC